MDFDYDILVIGSGPAGEGAAMQAVKSGRKVAIIEQGLQVGGDCTHGGTIPSKALRQCITHYTELKSNPIIQNFARVGNADLRAMLKLADSIIRSQVKLRRGFYDRNSVPVLHGTASFVDAHTVKVESEEFGASEITAAGFIIATGSRPYHPPGLDFSHPRILDSNSVLQMKFTPRSMSIFGAGVIGCEYASIFRGLDIKINLINTRERLLEFLDDEITDALAYHLRDQGVILRHGEDFEKIELHDDHIIVQLKSGKKIRTEALLWANGRSGNTDSLNLSAVGLQANSRGQIPVNADLKTEQNHIYAAGDVIGPPSLASAAYNQGRYAAASLLGEKVPASMLQAIPTGIYTSPEISSLGKTEKELTAEKVPYEVGHAAFRNLARAQIAGVTVGMLKILFHRETLQILGIHCFGHSAAEIIHIGQAIMNRKDDQNTIRYFTETVFNYPTMAEAYRVAALNGINRLD